MAQRCTHVGTFLLTETFVTHYKWNENLKKKKRRRRGLQVGVDSAGFRGRIFNVFQREKNDCIKWTNLIWRKKKKSDGLQWKLCFHTKISENPDMSQMQSLRAASVKMTIEESEISLRLGGIMKKTARHFRDKHQLSKMHNRTRGCVHCKHVNNDQDFKVSHSKSRKIRQ